MKLVRARVDAAEFELNGGHLVLIALAIGIVRVRARRVSERVSGSGRASAPEVLAWHDPRSPSAIIFLLILCVCVCVRARACVCSYAAIGGGAGHVASA